MTLDIRKNRMAQKYRFSEMILRFFWGLGQVIFRFSPRSFFSLRVFLLKTFGAKIGKNVHIYPSSIIYFPWNLEVGDWASIGEDVLVYNLGNILIGSKTTISHRAHLCAGTHDYSDPVFPLEKVPIRIDDNVWICADSFIGPGVSVGEGSVVGACSVVVKDVKPWTVVAGNPAIYIKNRVFLGPS